MPKVKAGSMSKGHLDSERQKRSRKAAVKPGKSPTGLTGKNTTAKGVSSKKRSAY